MTNASARARSRWRRAPSDAEYRWLRLFRALEEVETAIERLEEQGEAADVAVLASLRRLRKDMVAAVRVAAGPPAG